MGLFFSRESFAERLEQLREKTGLNKKEFGQLIGIQQYYSKLTGETPQIKSPRVDTLLRISEQFNVTVDWLLTGKEEKPQPFQYPEIAVQSVPRFKRYAAEFTGESYIPVRLLKDAAAAGPPSVIDENDIAGWALIYATREWMPNDPENYTCVYIRGQSMYPILSDGDIVAIDHAERNPFNLNGKMVAFRVEGGVTIKWLNFKVDEEVVVGIPENKEDLDHVVVLRGEQIDEGIVGQVRWWWSKR